MHFFREELCSLPESSRRVREFSFDGPPDALRKFIEQFSGDLAPRAMELYGLANGGTGQTDPQYGSVGNQWLADQIFRCPVTTQAISHNAAKNPVCEYQLEHAIPGQEKDGAVHSADLPYVFGFYPKTGNIGTFQNCQLGRILWANFAKTGDPNGTSVSKWSEFGKSQNYISITQDGEAASHSGGLRPQQCELYRNILESRKNAKHP